MLKRGILKFWSLQNVSLQILNYVQTLVRHKKSFVSRTFKFIFLKQTRIRLS